MKVRLSEQAARATIEAWLQDRFDTIPSYGMIEDGETSWAFWIDADDTTSYVHADLSIEWYGTSYEGGA